MVGPIHVELTWSVVAEPDGFEIVRDGVIMETDLIPDLIRTGDRTYKYVDESTVSNTTHTWEVRSIVDDVTSASNPTTSRRVKTTLLWIYDKASKPLKNLIPIAGEAPAEFTLFEKGETFEPLNGMTPVRITEALGGYRGSVTGTLCGECLNDGTTSQQLQDRILRVRKEVGRIFTLHLDNITIPVIIYNVNTFPKYGANPNVPYESPT